MKIKNIIKTIILFILTSIPVVVKADSGLDSNYEQSASPISALVNTLLSMGSYIGKIFTEHPGSEDYKVCQALIAILGTIIILIVTLVYIFKLGKKKKNIKDILVRIGISLIPTIIFPLICFLINIELIIYIIIFLAYIITLIIVVNYLVKKRLNEEINKLKEVDKNFNEEKFNNETFEIYKEIQLAWCDFNLDKVKELISEEMYNKYTEKLKDLKDKNQKNMMDEIELESNKIVDVNTENEIEITCEMSVKCIDYIIDDKEKIVKGNKKKKYKYKYRLTFIKNLKENKYVLVEKKMLNISTK